jgi:hypothetical protein
VLIMKRDLYSRDFPPCQCRPYSRAGLISNGLAINLASCSLLRTPPMPPRQQHSVSCWIAIFAFRALGLLGVVLAYKPGAIPRTLLSRLVMVLTRSQPCSTYWEARMWRFWRADCRLHIWRL